MSPESPLTRRQHEMITTMVSVTNRCRYCITSHAEFLRRVTLDTALVAALEYRAPRLVADALAAAQPQPPEPLRILDAGCGTGLCGPLLKPLAGYLAGVDLSPAMVARARGRRAEPHISSGEPIYDHLAVAELTSWIAAQSQQFDAVVAADVFVYCGTLDATFRAAATALRPRGIFVFTTERHDEDGATAGFKLRPHGRYSHSERYLRDELCAAGLALERFSTVELRMEFGEAVAGTLAVARKPP
jgi:AhpD family alkylhydroperoxidase